MTVAFKYPVGAAVEFKTVCEHGATHRFAGVIAAAFEAEGMAMYVVLHGPGGKTALGESQILGRVNTGKRVKNGG